MVLLGPRQCGKTTLARWALPSWTYLDLERPSDRARIAGDPEHFLKTNPAKVVLDEAHILPELFPVLRSHVDAARGRKGRYVLLGSANPSLVRGISESLAGRVGFVEMGGLRFAEVCAWKPGERLLDYWGRGSFPEPLFMRRDPDRWAWHEAYLQTVLERDLGRLGLRISPQAMAKFCAMLAHVHGGLWNASQLASSLGISYHTVSAWSSTPRSTCGTMDSSITCSISRARRSFRRIQSAASAGRAC